jgi:NAD(P)-dependent dehydrogenase (short-subunit alcohol dehydrogenase family)
MATISSDLVVVTGAANGIGRAIAERFVAEGRDVVGIDRDPTDVDFPMLRADLSNVGEISQLVEKVEDEFGNIAGLINVAGIYERIDPEAFSYSAYRRVLAVDLDAPILLAVAAAKKMSVRGYGRIVNVTSIHGEFGERGGLAYDVAKGGLNQATRTLALEFAPHGVLCNAVAPGYVDTAMATVDGVLESSTEEFRRTYLEGGKLPLGRSAQPRDIAGLVAWLASPDNSYVTGQVIRVDGGLTVTF